MAIAQADREAAVEVENQLIKQNLGHAQLIQQLINLHGENPESVDEVVNMFFAIDLKVTRDQVEAGLKYLVTTGAFVHDRETGKYDVAFRYP